MKPEIKKLWLATVSKDIPTWEVLTMKPEIKKLWVDALRSGKYKQGFYSLRNNRDEYCCLGVLCSLCPEIEPEKIVSPQIGETDSDVYVYNEQASYLPEVVIEWAGLGSADPVVEYNRKLDNITKLNDTLNLPFSKIADIIEDSSL